MEHDKRLRLKCNTQRWVTIVTRCLLPELLFLLLLLQIELNIGCVAGFRGLCLPNNAPGGFEGNGPINSHSSIQLDNGSAPSYRIYQLSDVTKRQGSLPPPPPPPDPNAPPHLLSSDEWNKAIGTGCQLLTLIQTKLEVGSPVEQYQSKFLDSPHDILPKYGWQQLQVSPVDLNSDPPVAGALKGLGVSTEPGNWAYKLWRHRMEYDENGVHKYSDITFLEWYYNQQHGASGGSGQVPSPDHIIIPNISSAESQNIINTALDKKGKRLGKMEWEERVEFMTSSDERKALLSAPNAKAVVWLLVSHKKQFGDRQVSKIVVFNPKDDNKMPFLAFFIGDVLPHSL
ncbi:hypothetical protein EJ08DRAFT_734941 [Tothia fuscella]|uniref:Uncharacterized protein n=1 Tax=Tothia fuscella TaxID=1048955 RepID=A0A9P4NPN5_9PEZI|nr:hypothetical protein EJ08DRAFT_734941 [Tothia fuscella]